MESEKLLPCPFCGAEDKYLVQAFTQATETFAFWSVECSFCGVEVADDESQEKANAAWNTRAPADMRPALAAETIERCALECLSLISIIGAHPGSSIDSALCAAADAIRALAPTKGDVS